MTVTGAAGTGDVTLNTATSGYLALSIADGDTFPYVLEDGSSAEGGVGTYHSSVPSFSRTTVRWSTAGGTTKISATSAAIMFSSIMGEDTGGGKFTDLADVAFDETDPSFDGFMAGWNFTDQKWEPFDITGTLDTILGDLAFANLIDGNLAPGPSADGWAITWNDGAGFYELADVSGGGGGGITQTPPVWSSLTAVTNLNSAAHVQNAANIPSLFVTPASGSDSVLYAAMAAVPSGHFSITTRCRSMMLNTDPGWKGCGITLHNSVNSNNWYFFRSPARAGAPYYFVVKFTGDFVTTTTVAGNQPIDSDEFYMHIDYDGTDITFALSFDGVNKNVVYTDSAVAFLGTPTHCGIGWSGAFTTTVGPYHTWFHYNAGALGSNGL